MILEGFWMMALGMTRLIYWKDSGRISKDFGGSWEGSWYDFGRSFKAFGKGGGIFRINGKNFPQNPNCSGC